MTRTDDQLEQWFIQCFKECDEIDATADKAVASEMLVDLVARINKAYTVFPKDQMIRCCEMAKDRM
jgi:hypothetical protein